MSAGGSGDVRPTVLVLAGRYLPGFRAGGPVRSIANMVAALGDEFRFRVVALDRDLGDDRPYPDAVDRWVPVGKAEVRYVPAGRGVARAVARLVRTEPYDLLYLNTFFDPAFGLVPLVARRAGLAPAAPVIVAPRGQFAPGAMRVGRRRKTATLAAARRLALRGDEIWQATSALEIDDITTAVAVPSAAVRVAANVPPAVVPATAAPPPKVPGVLRAVFLSRVARKKNLDGALRLLAGIRGAVSLDVVGPVEDRGYWEECVALAAGLGGRVTLRARGPVEPHLVAETFARYDLFYFPTHGENFGHVVLEALLAGCPVLVSDRTPWRGLEAARAGWDLPLEDAEGFGRALQWCVDADSDALGALRSGARAHALAYLAREESVAATRALLAGAAARR